MEEKANKGNTEPYHNQHNILYGQQAKQRAIAYADWLMTTMIAYLMATGHYHNPTLAP